MDAPASNLQQQAPVAANAPGEEEVLSKKGKKRLEKRKAKAEWHAARKEVEKKQRKEENERLRQEREAKLAQMTPEDIEELKKKKAEVLAERQKAESDKKARLDAALVSGQNIVIDLDFFNLMAPGERTSLVQQVLFSYSDNLKAAVPCRLSLTSLQGPTLDLFQKFQGFENWRLCRYAESYFDAFADRRADLVYLTADSRNVIRELQPDKIYIIGGLVDRNRHKYETMNRAKAQRIATARLPIAEHVKINSSQVLTVNQVVAILLQFMETKDWRVALQPAVPYRKRAQDDQSQGDEAAGHSYGGRDASTARLQQADTAAEGSQHATGAANADALEPVHADDASELDVALGGMVASGSEAVRGDKEQVAESEPSVYWPLS